MNVQQADLDVTTAAPSSGGGTDSRPRLGTFVILSELGKGGMGAVYRARDTNLDREVALKVLLPALSADPKARERFVREAKAQAKVEHDHIVPIHDARETDGIAFLVMPLLKGQSLGAALKLNRHPPLAEAVRIASEIAAGLAAAHAAGLIHRDIKPGNVWLEGPARRVKILDFGLARTAEESAPEPDAPACTATAPDLTENGAVVGTPAYMSPEQARGRKVDARSDLFALGVVLYEMVTGRKPFTGASAFEVLAAVTAFDPPAAVELNPAVPADLSDLIRALLAKEPSARPADAATVAALLAEIERAVAGLPTVVAVSAPPGEPNPWDDIDATEAAQTEVPAVPSGARGGGFKPLLLTGGAVLLAALAVGAAVVALNPRKKPPELGAKAVAQPDQKRPDTQPKPQEPPTPKEPLAVALFTKELSGWRSLPPNHWRMENGELVGAFPEGVTTEHDAHLTSAAQYGDYELAFAVRLTKGNVRGRYAYAEVYLRDQPGGKNAGGLRCMLGSDDWGGLRQNAANTVTKPAAVALATVNPTDFNDVVIRCTGHQFKVTLNGVVAVDERRERMHTSGALVWRFTSGTGEMRVRDIRLTDLTAPKP